MSAHGQALVGAPDAEATGAELDVVDRGLEQVGRDGLGLLDDLVGGPDERLASDDERARAVGVEAAVGDLGVAVQDLDVLEGDPEAVGDDLAERRFVSLPVGGAPVMISTLPVASIRTLACSQPPAP